MNYLPRNKSKPKSRVKVFSVTALFILLSLLTFLFRNQVRSTAVTVSKPIWLAGNSITEFLVKIKDIFILKNTLVAKNLALEDEIALLKLKEIDYDAISKENQDLKSQFGRENGAKRILSRVLSKPPRSLYDIFVIDVGLNQGVAIGSRVYLSDTVIVGTVASVTPTSSLVELFSTGNRKQDAVLSRTGASFILEGMGGANFKLEVPKDTDILWGDIFTYPSLASSVIGSVYYIDTNSQSSFKTVYLRMLGNVFSTQWVLVE